MGGNPPCGFESHLGHCSSCRLLGGQASHRPGTVSSLLRAFRRAIPVSMASRVLVVDDDAELRAVPKEALREAGFDAVTARDGFEAMRIARADVPDLVLLDVLMPLDRKSTRLNSSHLGISYAVFCLKKKNQ